jgi:hypothetical protein
MLVVCFFGTSDSGPRFRERIERELSAPFELKAAKAQRLNGNGLAEIT